MSGKKDDYLSIDFYLILSSDVNSFDFFPKPLLLLKSK